MNAEVSKVYLKSVASGQLVEAELYDTILPRHLEHFTRLWSSDTVRIAKQHGHWDWTKKWRYFSAQLSYQSFAIECDKETQGMMIVNTMARCRIPEQWNKHLVYVEYLEAAPWNRIDVGKPQYKLIGTTMLAAAIQLSHGDGNHGRIGLHSLPQADDFYRRQCGMTDLGPDTSKQNLSYFEMTVNQAAKYMRGRT